MVISSSLDEDIAKFCREHGFIGWGLVSAKEGTGIEEAASRLGLEIVKILTKIILQSWARYNTAASI